MKSISIALAIVTATAVHAQEIIPLNSMKDQTNCFKLISDLKKQSTAKVNQDSSIEYNDHIYVTSCNKNITVYTRTEYEKFVEERRQWAQAQREREQEEFEQLIKRVMK
jgi:hypothetical protein